jgi:KUP system potassium uptake protein
MYVFSHNKALQPSNRQQTTKLGNAYGVCVILDTIITTTLVSLVALIVWRIKWYFVAPLWLLFATFEGLYLTSALTKVPDGAWFTLCLAFCIATIFSTWRYGKEAQWNVERKGQLLRLSKLVKSDGMGVLHLNDMYGGGELTKTKGMSYLYSVSTKEGI